MTKLYRYGGIVASIILIAFGIGSIVVGANGRSRTIRAPFGSLSQPTRCGYFERRTG